MQIFLLKCVRRNEITYPYMINQKIVKHLTKSATRTFREYAAQWGQSAGQSKRVALFFTPEHATAQGRRGRLLECAYDVCFPEAYVGNEKIAKYI